MVGNRMHSYEQRSSESAPMKPSIYWLFVFVPITVILEHAGKVPPPVVFFSAARDQKYNPAAARYTARRCCWRRLALLCQARSAVTSHRKVRYGRKSCSTSESPACCC